MKNLFFILVFFSLLQNNLIASNKKDILNKLSETENLSFNFVQTIGGKDERGKCTIKYPKKIFCEYEKRIKKVLVSNGTSVVIKKGTQYFRYPITSTPFEFLLDKNFLINKIKVSNLNDLEDKYLFIEIKENNNNINIFFSKKDYEIIGWQVEDIYQNLSVTYIFNTIINKKLDDKIFKLPPNN